MGELNLTEEQLFNKMLDWIFMWNCYDYSKAEFEPKEHVLSKLEIAKKDGFMASSVGHATLIATIVKRCSPSSRRT